MSNATQDHRARPSASTPSAISIRDLTVAYQQKPVIWDIDLELPKGALIAVVGPNGAGKSTLLKSALELIPRTAGEVLVDGAPFRKQRHRVAYVPQRESVDWDFPVNALEVVTMGTYRRLGWFRPVTRACRERARNALAQVGLADYATRQISKLSGGQQQRVFLARALAQDADIYFMDEPFAAVDASTEQAIVELLHTLRSAGKTCLVVHHDLATVPRYFNWLVLLNMRVVKSGPMDETFTAENLRKTYGGKLSLMSDAISAFSQQAKS